MPQSRTWRRWSALLMAGSRGGPGHCRGRAPRRTAPCPRPRPVVASPWPFAEGPMPTDEPAAAPPARASSRGRWIVAAALALAVGLFYALGLHDYFTWGYLRANLGRLEAAVEDSPVAAVLVFVAVYTA